MIDKMRKEISDLSARHKFISDQAFRDALDFTKPGKLIDFRMRELGVSGLSF